MGDNEYGADFLEWEERGVWYTPPDADVDAEGAWMFWLARILLVYSGVT